MARYDHLPLWRDALQLAVLLEAAVGTFPRVHKYTLGAEMRRQALVVCRWIIRASAATRDRETSLEQLPTLHNRRSTMKPMTILVVLLLAMTCAASALAQSCYNTIVATTPTSRFVDNANGTVTDNATGLVWKRCSEGQSWDGATCTGSDTTSTWKSALQTGSDAVFAGANDWRLPSKNELASLVERQCFSPAINATIFPATRASNFWSSSPVAGGSDGAWVVHFGYGGVSSVDHKYYFDYAVRLVRGGQ